MPISTWIRDIFGIRKDLIDTKKSTLEVKKLEEDDRARNLVTPATMEDIKEHDPKYLRIKRITNAQVGREVSYGVRHFS